MKGSYFPAFVVSFLIISSCSSTREAADTRKIRMISPKSLSSRIDKRQTSYDWFAAKIKMNYDDGKMDQAFTANIRMRKDSLIWMSLTGFLGIEGGRVLITNDSIKIIDRLNRKFYNYPLSYASKYVPFQNNLHEIQNLITGDKLFEDKEIESVEIKNQMYGARLLDNLLDIDFWVNPKNYTYSEFRLKHRFDKQEVIYKFDDYKNVDEQLISYSRKIEIDNGDKKVFVDMDFSRIDLNKVQNFPFEVPEKYERASF